MRTVIIGNSGSGKTWLASGLAKSVSAPVIHLDELFWEPGGFNKKRSDQEITSLIQASKRQASWVVEGVFGDLAEQYLEDAECLIWLDLPWPVCRARLERRGSESKQHLGREQSAQELEELIEWASQYHTRSGKSSHQWHKALFGAFPKTRLHIQNEESAVQLVAEAQHLAKNEEN